MGDIEAVSVDVINVASAAREVVPAGGAPGLTMGPGLTMFGEPIRRHTGVRSVVIKCTNVKSCHQGTFVGASAPLHMPSGPVGLSALYPDNRALVRSARGMCNGQQLYYDKTSKEWTSDSRRGEFRAVTREHRFEDGTAVRLSVDTDTDGAMQLVAHFEPRGSTPIKRVWYPDDPPRKTNPDPNAEPSIMLSQPYSSRHHHVEHMAEEWLGEVEEGWHFTCVGPNGGAAFEIGPNAEAAFDAQQEAMARRKRVLEAFVEARVAAAAALGPS
jgi:hypothetical protein